jgi:hypothetical protein
MIITSADGNRNIHLCSPTLLVDNGGSYLRLTRVTGTLVLSCQKSPDPIVTLACWSSKAEQHGIDMGVGCVAGHRLPNLQDMYVLSVDFSECRSLCAGLSFLPAPLRLQSPSHSLVVRSVPPSIQPHVDRPTNHIAIAIQASHFLSRRHHCISRRE